MEMTLMEWLGIGFAILIITFIIYIVYQIHKEVR